MSNTSAPTPSAPTPFPPNAGHPYGAVPYPYGPRSAKTNGMAIAALILGICGFLLLPACVGIGLGIGAQSTIKRTGQPGRGIAVAGIVVSAVWLLFWALLFILS